MTSRYETMMGEIEKMASEGLISEGDLSKIKENVEQAKTAGLFGLGSKLISRGQFGRMAAGKMSDRGQVDALYSAISMGGKKNILGSADQARHAINVAAAKGDNFSGYLDDLMKAKGGGGTNWTIPAVAGTATAASVVGQAAYESQQSSKNFESMMAENQHLYDLPEENVRRAYRVVSTFAPNMTDDPFVAGSAVQKLVEYEAVDPATVKSLQDSAKTDHRVVPRLLQTAQQVIGPAAKAMGGGGGE